MKYTFKAFGPGVIVPHPKEDGHQVCFADWLEKRKWCENQGWKLGEDFLLPGTMINARWYFRIAEYQFLFVMRWA